MSEYTSFSQMRLSEETLHAVGDLGYTAPTPIQAQSIDCLLQGYDLIGQSQTGTGKTAAFALPLIERIEALDRSLQAVVLCPTRELAVQVAGEIRKLLKYHNSIRVVPIYGGQPIDRQIQALKGGVQIIVATPGRFLDHMERHTIKPRSVQMVVLDEADEMLDMGFREDIETILNAMPEERQSVLFSATMGEDILQLANTYLRDPKVIRTMPEELTLAGTREVYFDIKEKMKTEALCRVLEYEAPGLCLVFCNTKKRADELGVQLHARGIEALVLHGDLDQRERDIVMKKFRSHTTGLMIATDIAARGLDIENIDLVVNYDVPDQAEFYVHRIGRTGRAGKEGLAYTFVVGREMARLEEISRYTGSPMEAGHLPTLSDMESKRTGRFLEQIRLRIDENSMDHSLDHATRLVEQLDREGYDPAQVAAALIAEQLHLDEETPFELTSGAVLPEKDYSKEAKETLYLNIGARQRIRSKDIIGAISANTGIRSYMLGEIRVEDAFTSLEIPRSLVSELLEIMSETTIKGYPARLTREDPSKTVKDASPRKKQRDRAKNADRSIPGKKLKKGVKRRS